MNKSHRDEWEAKLLIAWIQHLTSKLSDGGLGPSRWQPFTNDITDDNSLSTQLSCILHDRYCSEA